MLELVSVNIVYLVFAALLFIGFVYVCHVLLGQEILYSNISNIVSFLSESISFGVTKYFLKSLQGSI